MAEIINGPVNIGEISIATRKRVVRAQRHGAAVFCVPIDVEIKGGSYIPVTGRDNLHPWDTVGEFRFSLFVSKGAGNIAERVVRYNLTGDGRMRRLKAAQIGLEIDEHENIVPKIEWYEDLMVRGVDAKVTKAQNPQTGEEVDVLHFVAVPEPGQWGGVEGFGDKFPGADRQRSIVNSIDNPIPFLQPVGVVF